LGQAIIKAIRAAKGGETLMEKNFMDNEWIFKAYDQWVNSPTPFENNYLNRERFYSFMISCVKYVKEIKFVTKQEAWKSINMDILKEHLCTDLRRRENSGEISGWEDRVYETLIRFEKLLEYEKVRYSHGLK
jgi:hypothetical protein